MPYNPSDATTGNVAVEGGPLQIHEALVAYSAENAVYSPASRGHGVSGDSPKNMRSRRKAISAIAVDGATAP